MNTARINSAVSSDAAHPARWITVTLCAIGLAVLGAAPGCSLWDCAAGSRDRGQGEISPAKSAEHLPETWLRRAMAAAKAVKSPDRRCGAMAAIAETSAQAGCSALALEANQLAHAASNKIEEQHAKGDPERKLVRAVMRCREMLDVARVYAALDRRGPAADAIRTAAAALGKMRTEDVADKDFVLANDTEASGAKRELVNAQLLIGDVAGAKATAWSTPENMGCMGYVRSSLIARIAMHQARKGDWAGATDTVKSVPGLFHKSQACVSLAGMKRDAGDLNAARRFLAIAEAAMKTADDAGLVQMVASILVAARAELGDIAEAWALIGLIEDMPDESFAEAFETTRALSDACFALLEVLAEQGKPVKAMETAKRMGNPFGRIAPGAEAILRNSEESVADSYIFTALCKAGHFAKASIAAGKLTDSSDRLEAYCELTGELFKAGRRDAAAKCIESALGAAAEYESPGGRSYAFRTVAASQLSVGDRTGAGRSLRRARREAESMEVESEGGRAARSVKLCDVVESYIDAGDVNGAGEVAKGIATPGTIVRAQAELAQAYAREGRLADMRACLAAIERQDPTKDAVRYMIEAFSRRAGSSVDPEGLPYKLAEILARSGHVDKLGEWIGPQNRPEMLWRYYHSAAKGLLTGPAQAAQSPDQQDPGMGTQAIRRAGTLTPNLLLGGAGVTSACSS